MIFGAILAATLVASARAEIKNRCTKGGMLAMTWDDGPADFTPQLLDILDEKNVKATFHITTQYLTDPNVQSTIQRIAQSGHLIGLRTEPSWDLFAMSDDQIKASIARQSSVLAEFIGYYPKFIRLPYKKYDDRIRAAIESTGAVITVHNLETYDYTGDSNRINKAFHVSLSLAGKGAGSFISVQHDGVQASVSTTPAIIDNAKNMGYKLVRLDECLGLADMTKDKKALEGGDGQAVAMEIDNSTGGSSPFDGAASPVAGGKKKVVGGNANGGKKVAGGASLKGQSSAAAIPAPAIYTVAAAALAAIFLAL